MDQPRALFHKLPKLIRRHQVVLDNIQLEKIPNRPVGVFARTLPLRLQETNVKAITSRVLPRIPPLWHGAVATRCIRTLRRVRKTDRLGIHGTGGRDNLNQRILDTTPEQKTEKRAQRLSRLPLMPQAKIKESQHIPSHLSHGPPLTQGPRTLPGAKP